MVAKLAIRHVEYNSVVNPCPIGVARKKNKFRLRIDEVFDQPRTSNPVHFNFLASHPPHSAKVFLTVEIRILLANVAGLQIASYGGSKRVSQTNKYVRDCLLCHHRLCDWLSAVRSTAAIGSSASLAYSRFA